MLVDDIFIKFGKKLFSLFKLSIPTDIKYGK